jgi:hypothetical protein
MNRPAVSYDELDERMRGDGHGGYVGLSAIDGLIAAVVAGPVVCHPANRLVGRGLWWKGASDQARIARRASRQYRPQSHHDAIDTFLRDAPGNYSPIFMHDRGKVHVEDWAIGFALGLTLGGQAWTPILLAKPRPIITPIMVVNPQLAKLLVRVSPDDRRKLRATAHHHIGSAILLSSSTRSPGLPGPRIKIKNKASGVFVALTGGY